MSSVLGGGGSRAKAYMEDTTVPQSAVKSSSPVVLRHAALQMLVELCRFPPPGRLLLSALVSPELLILHLHQGPPNSYFTSHPGQRSGAWRLSQLGRALGPEEDMSGNT